MYQNTRDQMIEEDEDSNILIENVDNSLDDVEDDEDDDEYEEGSTPNPAYYDPTRKVKPEKTRWSDLEVCYLLVLFLESINY